MFIGSAPSPSSKALHLSELDALRSNMDDNRRIKRTRVLKDGKIIFNAGGSLVNCSIRDLTIGGAKVCLIAPTALPECFELLCVADGIFYPAKMAWRRGEHVGLTFVGAPRHMPHRKKACNSRSLD